MTSFMLSYLNINNVVVSRRGGGEGEGETGGGEKDSAFHSRKLTELKSENSSSISDSFEF